MRKLRNRVSGETGLLLVSYDMDFVVISRLDKSADACEVRVYDSAEKLNAEWEDYEKPTGCWIINIFGVVEYTHFRNEAEAELLKEIGNYFETRKEAEKAVEKLKAWKRLKDKGGFKFTGCARHGDEVVIRAIYAFYDDDIIDLLDDLELLFGGEE